MFFGSPNQALRLWGGAWGGGAQPLNTTSLAALKKKKNSSECPCPQLHQQRVCINKSLAPVAVFRQCWIFRLRPLIHDCPALILPTPLTFYHLWIYLIAHSHVTMKVIKKTMKVILLLKCNHICFQCKTQLHFQAPLSLNWDH